MSHEAVTGVRQRASWVDSRRMPADDGTRPDETGKLKIGRILFAPRVLVLEVFSGSGNLTIALTRAGIEQVQSWDIVLGRRYDLLIDDNVKRFF